MEYPKTTGEISSKTVTSGYMKVGAQQGWQCPVCGSVNSPWTSQCPCHGNPIWNTTTVTAPNITMSEYSAEEKDK